MKISKIFKQNKIVLSCEVFPPKPENNIETIYKTISEIKKISPDFISVTYRPDGGTKKRTVQICDDIKNKYNLEPLMHLTCIDTSKKDIENILQTIKEKNIQNILALRGDLPREREKGDTAGDFSHANNLVEFIEKLNMGFCSGVAGYPEGHPESECPDDDLRYLKKKINAGAQFIITQLFFENDYLYRFMDRIRSAGIKVPVSAGIMPVFKASLVKKMVSMCGATITPQINDMINKYSDKPEEMLKAGIDYARNQTEKIIDSGTVQGIHLYTMNCPQLANDILMPLKK